MARSASAAFSILIASLLAASASPAATIGTFAATSQLDWHPAPNLMGTGTGSGSALLGSGGVLSIDIAETLDIFDNGAFQSNVTFTNTYQISGSLSGASLTGTSGTVTGTACQYNFGPVDLCAVWVPGITTALPAVDDPIIFDLAAAGRQALQPATLSRRANSR